MTLVLLHPLGADRTVWDPVIERLDGRREVIALDLPGFGDAPSLDGEPTPAALADAVHAAVGDREYDVAVAMFVAHPERMPPEVVARLVRAYGRAPGFPAVNAAMRANTFTGLEQIRVPVTLAWPEHDRMVARLRRVPPNVRSVILRGCGHLPMWDDPQQVAELLSP